MIAASRFHRPCPRCGNRFRRTLGPTPQKCDACGHKLRAKLWWSARCSCGWESEVRGTTRKAARLLWLAHREQDCEFPDDYIWHEPRYTLGCDCGWSTVSSFATAADELARRHRQEHAS